MLSFDITCDNRIQLKVLINLIRPKVETVRTNNNPSLAISTFLSCKKKYKSLLKYDYLFKDRIKCSPGPFISIEGR